MSLEWVDNGGIQTTRVGWICWKWHSFKKYEGMVNLWDCNDRRWCIMSILGLIELCFTKDFVHIEAFIKRWCHYFSFLILQSRKTILATRLFLDFLAVKAGRSKCSRKWILSQHLVLKGSKVVEYSHITKYVIYWFPHRWCRSRKS